MALVAAPVVTSLLRFGVRATLLLGACGEVTTRPTDAAIRTPDATTQDSAAADARACAEGDVRLVDPASGRCYMRFHQALDFQAARAECRRHGADLVSITSAAENALVAQLAGQDRLAIGLTDEFLEGSYTWASGEIVAYQNWAPGEPNNGGGAAEEDCAILLGIAGNQGWDDRPCSAAYGFVCER